MLYDNFNKLGNKNYNCYASYNILAKFNTKSPDLDLTCTS